MPQVTYATGSSSQQPVVPGPSRIASPPGAKNMAMGIHNRNVNSIPAAPYQSVHPPVSYQQRQPLGFAGYQNFPPVANEEEAVFRNFCLTAKRELYPLLLRGGVKTFAQFVHVDVEKLSELMAKAFNMDKDYARDLLGGMRLTARSNYARWIR